MDSLVIKEGGQLIIKEGGELVIKQQPGNIIIVVLAFAWLGLLFFIYARLGKFGLWNKVKKGDKNGKKRIK